MCYLDKGAVMYEEAGNPDVSTSYTVQILNWAMFHFCGFLFSQTSEEEVGC